MMWTFILGIGRSIWSKVFVIGGVVLAAALFILRLKQSGRNEERLDNMEKINEAVRRAQERERVASDLDRDELLDKLRKQRDSL